MKTTEEVAATIDHAVLKRQFGDGPATPEAVEIMAHAVGNEMKIKASGGIKTWEAAVGYLEQGCSRLGMSATETILKSQNYF